MILYARRLYNAAFLMALSLCCVNNSSLFADWSPDVAQFTDSGNGFDGNIASDANGNAIAIWKDEGSVYASYFTAGNWGDAQLLSNSARADGVSVAMDASGTALAIWRDLSFSDPTTFGVTAAFFDGTSWVLPAVILDNDIDNFDLGREQAIAMDGAGNGVAVWTSKPDPITGTSTAFFSASSQTWGSNSLLSQNYNRYPSIAYSLNGTVVASWQDQDGINVDNFDGTMWQPPILLDPGVFGMIPVGIDAFGDALALWIDSSHNVIYNQFISGSWGSNNQVLSLTSGNSLPALAVAPGGTAVAVWLDSNNTAQSSSYNGAAFESPVPYATDVNDPPSVAVNAAGNALSVWDTISGEIQSSLMLLGQSWLPAEIVDASGGFQFENPVASLSDNGRGFTVWSDLYGQGEAQDVFGDFTIVEPPSNLIGSLCTTHFVAQKDCIHILTWTPSTDTTVIGYNLRRNGKLIAEISAAGPYTYYDYDRCKGKHDVYELTAVNIFGLESDPITFSF